MARPVWSGTISFGLVAIPVELVNAVRQRQISFNQLDDRTMSRIRYRKVSAATGEEVPDQHIVKGYELAPGRYVVVDPDELESLLPAATRTIDLEEFVALDEIDPVYFDRSFVVVPKDAAKPYALLARAMEEAGKVALGRFVMRNKQYVAALRAVDGTLRMHTMVFADEIVDIGEFAGLAGLDEIEVSKKEMATAQALVDSLTTSFDPSRFTDTHREAILSLIRRTADGEQIEVADGERPPAPVIDLAAALEASLKAAKAARERHPTSRAKPAGAKSAVSEPAPATKAAKRSAAEEPAPARRRAARKSA